MIFPPRRLLAIVASACAVVAAGILMLAAPAAQADVVSLSACNNNALGQVFAQWADPAYYELAPGGDFSSAPGWSLSGGAALQPGGEPFAVGGSVSQSSLSLPAGATSTSAPTCVNAAYPDIRFFVAGTGIVQVSVIYDGTVITSGTVAATGAWAPSPVVVTGSAITGALNGGTAQVSLRFTALSGNPRISDVYIDPWHGCC